MDALPSDTESEAPATSESDCELDPASLPAGVPLSAKGFDHRTLWHRGASVQTRDAFGYERNPAFWFTLNLPYNHLHEIHRFAHATAEAKKHVEGRDEDDADVEMFMTPTDLRDEQARRYRWAQDNADIVVFMHALRVELLVELSLIHI